MKSALKFLLSLLSIYGFSQNSSIDSISINIKHYLKDAPNNTQISAAVINKSNTVYLGFIKESDSIKVISNENSVFEIGSISKVFTSILFAKLVQNKTLSLNETIDQSFKFNIPNGHKITLTQLSNHTAGLPKIPNNMMGVMMLNANNPYKAYTTELFDAYLSKLELDNAPGTVNKYSNTGAGLLGYILTKTTNLSYEALLHQYIFSPLNMSKSSSLLTKINPKELVKGLTNGGNETSNWDFTDALVGAGGIKSSVSDLEKFVKHNFTKDPAYSLTHKPTFTINKRMNMGLGWHIIKGKTKTISWHNGATGGYTSSLGINLNDKQAVILLTNLNVAHPTSRQLDGLCFRLFEAISLKKQ